ncbi:MAG: DUF6152 family protein [Gammaproteobacteria bacterium]|jgi:hypothetical protein
MKRLFSFLLLASVVVLMTTNVAQAHHSFAMFDNKTFVTKTGTIVRWAFNNPHTWLYLNVKNADDSETLWSFEGAGVTGLIQRGVTGNTIKPGDTVTFMYCPLRDGRPGGAIGWVKLADGKALNLADGGCTGTEETSRKR